MKMTVEEIGKAVSSKNDLNRFKNVEVTSVAFDSRKLKSGALFIPLVGTHDGHDYLSSAIKNGAVATLWSDQRSDVPSDFPAIVVHDTLAAFQTLAKFYLHKVHPKVIAVTGSNGKTTTKDMIAAVLSTKYNVIKTPNNYNNNIGVPYTMLSINDSTDILVVEMGMDRSGQLDFLSKLVTPDIAVITMIGEAHIEYFGTRDRIADAKVEITHGLKDSGTFVYYGDEPLLRERAKRVHQKQLTFGRRKNDDLYATSTNDEQTKTSFKTNRFADTNFIIPMMGDYNVNNALDALLVGSMFKVTPEQMKRGLLDVHLTQNRAEWMVGSKGELILSDVYNSNPTAARVVLDSFSKTKTNGKRIVVLGDMLELGRQSEAMHVSLSKHIDPKLIDSVYLIGTHVKALYHALLHQYSADHLHYYPTDQLKVMTQKLKSEINRHDEILLKASHGIHLEKVLDELQPKKLS
ncbi:UDP-N-acetylmuramoyl-tripeptide--D-alanyl-D-alanine ligase [Philodulcilactobacillus myokoensis]|uniref:UDP-N-acetylmuramoyl-tripeptide--D-alanyl-D-alanine ligase n=1 Tax=Philodulcilactobacillus myokoensis TaxID=2929573 RepID=A0A9W6ETT9_9LACO|nr:UDP-N-acetylmuramoyl-tripeptide--D-alanyl-D-alanine ligase [Philodulcilactobacillus myokoensis]GLB47214.1 UDP-N-acetylmuramoyl-tripeptide--D-alanyl-D-alanine ligase [Philodulcilactobacillus myokoensis]